MLILLAFMPQLDEHLPYLRHKKGGGKLFDTSEACERSFVDRESEIFEDSSVYESKIVNSKVQCSTVSKAVVRNSWVAFSNVHGGMIEDSVIAAEFVGGNVRIENCEISGKSRVAHTAVCESVRFKDLTVKGDAKLLTWHQGEHDCFDGRHGYITRGVWRRPPRVVRMPFDMTITESVPGFVFVACVEFSIDRWLRVGERYGRAQGITPAEVDTIRQILLLWKSSPLSLDPSSDPQIGPDRDSTPGAADIPALHSI